MPAAALRTPQQNRAIWALRGALAQRVGEDVVEDLVAQWCQELSGQTRTSRLTLPQADRLLSRLREAVDKHQAPSARRRSPPPPTPEPEPPAPDVVTRRQQEVLGALFAQAGVSDRLGWARRICGRPWPQTQADWTKVARSLEALIRRDVSPQQFAERVAAAAAHPGLPGLDNWKRGWVADVNQRLTQAPADQVLTPHRLAKLDEVEAALAVALRVRP